MAHAIFTLARRLLLPGVVAAALGFGTSVGVAWSLAVFHPPCSAFPSMFDNVARVPGDPPREMVRSASSRCFGTDAARAWRFTSCGFGYELALSRHSELPLPDENEWYVKLLPMDEEVWPDLLANVHLEARGWPALCLASVRASHGAGVHNRSLILPTWIYRHTMRFNPNPHLPTIPLWSGMAVNTAFYCAVWLLLGAALCAAPRMIHRARARGKCPRCAYDLRNLPEPGCPECGWLRTPRPEAATERRT